MISFFLSFFQRNLDLGHQHSEWLVFWLVLWNQWMVDGVKQTVFRMGSKPPKYQVKLKWNVRNEYDTLKLVQLMHPGVRVSNVRQGDIYHPKPAKLYMRGNPCSHVVVHLDSLNAWFKVQSAGFRFSVGFSISRFCICFHVRCLEIDGHGTMPIYIHPIASILARSWWSCCRIFICTIKLL